MVYLTVPLSIRRMLKRITGASNRLSQAVFSVSELFNSAFERDVLRPVKNASGEDWPSKVFGYDMATNLNAIGYGRINFSNQLQMFNEQMSPERQVLIYCYYIMRQHYCSSWNIFITLFIEVCNVLLRYL